jgi:hypothetical protein
MGTILVTDDGEWLEEHEGWVQFRLSKPLVVPPLFSDSEPDSYEGWTTAWVDGIEELRCAARAGCECGWRGPETPWPGGEPTEEEREALMEPWYDEHVNPIRREHAALSHIRAAHDALQTIETQMHGAEDTLTRAVRAARDQGVSWTQIGYQLGVSKQAAQQRFGGDRETVTS